MTLNFSPIAVERSCPYNSPRKYRILRMSCSTVDSASPVCSIDSGSGGANGSGPCTLMQRIFHQVRGEEYSCLWLIGFSGLERKIRLFGSCVETSCLRQIQVRIHRRAADADFIMQVRPGGAAGGAHTAHDVAAAHFLAGANVNLGKVRVIGLDAAAVVNHDQPAVAAADPFGMRHDAVRGGAHALAHWTADIDALVKRAFTRERIGALPVGAHDEAAVHRPERGARAQRLQT